MAHDAAGEVRERTDIVELVSQYVALKKAGRSFKGLCPFHHEKTPSFIVFPESQNFHCFGCARGGDVFSFYMGVEKIEFKEALVELARRAGVTLASMSPVAPEIDAHRQRLLELNETAVTYYANLLANSGAGASGRELVKARGLNAEMMARFQLGFAPDGWDHLSKYLVARDVDPALALEAGLLQPRDSGGHYDRFRNRLLFPIKDRDGRTVGFGGRALGDAQPKYLNSPQTPVFDKSMLLYGLDLAKDAIRKADRVVIVEGYMDVIAAHQFGHANVVAAMGTAVTEAQIGLVKRLTKRIALALDADAAGQMATIRSLETMQQSLDHEETPVPDAMGVIRFERKLNAEISIVTLPDGKDPDELIRRAPDIWPAIVESAQPFLDFYIDQAVKRAPLDDPKAKSAVVSLVSPLLRQIPDRIVQAHYVELLASRLRIDQRLVLAEVRRAHLVGGAKDTVAAGRRSSLPKRSSHEDHLVALLLQQRALCRDIVPNVPMEYLHDERNRQIIEVLKDDAIPDLDAHQLIAGFDDPIADHAERLLEGLVGKPSLLPGQIRREAAKSLDQLGKERFTFLLQELQAEISEAQREGDASLVGELVPRLSALTDRHRGFYPPKSPYFKDSRDTGAVQP